MDRNKILKMVAVLAAIIVIVGSLTRLAGGDSLSLSEYAAQNASARPQGSPAPSGASPGVTPVPEASPATALTGAALNGSSRLEQRTTYTDGFYYEPLSDNLRRYITGVSYSPARNEDEPEDSRDFLDKLRYVHIWHFDFQGEPSEGELICHEAIARDLVEIFYELYRNEYQLEKVLLTDEYDGDGEAARADNCSFCFYTVPADGEASLARHSLGLAVDINPCYNPRILYGTDGAAAILPADSADYADRSAAFPYKIDEDDLCYKLFIRHGFTWGGSRNNGKDYQHFQKALPSQGNAD